MMSPKIYFTFYDKVSANNLRSLTSFWYILEMNYRAVDIRVHSFMAKHTKSTLFKVSLCLSNLINI